MSEFIQKIEELSVTFVMADLTDLQALADLYKRFEEIANLAKTEQNQTLAKIAIAASKLIEKIILDEVEDKNRAIEVISQTISSMQSIAVHNRNINEAGIPNELNEFIPDGLDMGNEITEKAEEKEQETSEIIKEQASKSDDSTDVASEQSVLIGDESLIADFIVEAREHLHEADVQLLNIESDPKNNDALNAVYRSFHTIKGVAGFLNLKDIATLAHATEDLLDRARKGELLLVGAPIDVTFNAVDAMKQMISDVETALSTKKALVHNLPLSELLSAIKSASLGEIISENDTSKEQATSIPSTEVVQESDQEQTSEMDNLVSSPDETKEIETNIIKIDQEIKEDHGIKEATQLSDQKDFQERSQARLVSSQGVVKETIKIEAERLDRLVDMIGELVIAESMVTQDTEIMNKASARVSRNLAHLNKITRELQEIGMSLRMMPVRPVFERMARLARDLAKKSGKKIEFTMSGEDTELDKSVVEKISDPLTHMIRNAIDHGIESSPSERVKLGKSEIGHISLKAFHKGGDIIIEVSDDGKGLDKDAILAKAKERGIIREDQVLSEQEIYNLIFMPGFSTAKVVTDVSGRGVGMDVVNRNVQALRGQVEIHSVVGKGATFMLRLPLTLAIMDGIIVQVGSEQYIIPTLSVVESIRPKSEEISTVMGNSEMLCIRGKLLPMFRISNLFQLHDAIKDPTEALIVVVEDEGKQVGFMVDSLVGHQQIVIKSLGESMGDLKGISGGAIMADGRVGLILDVAGIVKLAITGMNSSLAA
ncbi:TPA: chemotaxis protein CheA [Candidatus Poribacteria bacterium]|nr:chemotaxis protein CheA [Candidatus Poribacteria bacterium]